MHGRRSLFLDFGEYNPKIEYSLSKIRVKKHESKEKIAQEQTHLSNLKSISLPLITTQLQVLICSLLWGHLRLNIILSKWFHPFMG